MFGPGSLLAAVILAGTPSGPEAVAWVSDDPSQVKPASYAADDPIRPQDDPFHEEGHEPVPPPPDPGYVDGTGLPPEDGQQTLPGQTPDEWTSPGMMCSAEASTPVCDWLWGIYIEGWVDQGFTVNTDSPNNRSNIPVTFNNRSNEYQFNQVYIVLDRPAGEKRHAWDIGGRVDLLYGTDSFFVGSVGLENHLDGTGKWNSQQYGLAMPQAYVELYAPWGDGVTVRLGHFYTILGYESVPAVDNFFYSHSYAMQYGEPFTHTGFVASLPFGEIMLQAGVTRGWDTWEDNNSDMGVLFGAAWTSEDELTSIAFAMHASREQDQPPPGAATGNTFSLVVQHAFTDRMQYIIQYDHGFEPEAAANGGDAQWYGLNQYLLYTINDDWTFGIRYEWFSDEDATRVNAAWGSDYFATTVGFNWTPTDCITVRPSLRWDWVDTSGYYPFADGTEHDQILIDCDVIWRF